MFNYIIKDLFFNGVKKECLKVIISKEDYNLCDEYSKKRWSNEKTGHYGKGLANTTEDAYKVTRTGLLGEMAFGKIFDLSVDFQYRKYGDNHDFIVGENKKVDIKTALTLYKYNCGLIYAKNESGYDIPLKSDVYVFAFVEKEYRERQMAIIEVIGYIKKENIINRTPVIGRKVGSRHMNFEIQYDELSPIRNLLTYHKSIINS